ncbi:MAG: hypothetical protein LBQ35_03475 [Spirochaetaceae bacterium]|jgi:hypothetical protein|nr:hypothetical protein [Spirochaetaceae bacterium]
MIRIEIIANHSVEENILEALGREQAGKFYTRYSGVYGTGHSGPRMGDAIWPEENFVLVIWCEMNEAEAIERAVNSVKADYPNEGIKLFGIPDPAALKLPAPDAPPPQGETETASGAAPSAETVSLGAASAADSSTGAEPAAAIPPAPPPPPPNFGGESF